MAQAPDEKPYIIYSGDISFLEGQLLTHLDAMIADPQQRKAAKDILGPLLWNWAVQNPRAESYEVAKTEEQPPAEYTGPVSEPNEMGRQDFDHEKALEEN